MNHLALKIKHHSNGQIAVDQYTVGDYDITFNPDINRFCVCNQGEYETIATFAGTGKGLSNAIQWARKQTVAQ